MSRALRVLSGLGLVVAIIGLAITTSLLSSSGAWTEATHRPGSVASALAVAVAVTVVSLGLRWVRWSNLVRRCGVLVPTRDGAKLYAATLPAIATPFYVGELVRAGVLARRYPGRGWSYATVWALERLGDLMAALTVLAALDHQPLLVPACLIAWAGLHGALATFGATGDNSLADPSAIALTMTLSLAAWALPGAGLAVVAHRFGSTHGFVGLAAVFYRGTVLGGLTGSPLGVGITGVLLIHGLRAVGMIDRSATLAVATFRAGTSWFAVLAGLATLAVWRRGARAPHIDPAVHFDAIAAGYAGEIPEFTRARLVGRKLALLGDQTSERGLEVGCGHGWYAAELVNRGCQMAAFDVSRAQVREAADTAAAHGVSVGLSVADASSLPYPDGSFGFAFAINVVHHMTDPDARQRGLEEVVRVLRPGGTFFLQEINVTNPLFRFYMGYVFPLLHRIDEGTERWIHPRRLPAVAGATWDGHIDYITFLPEFAPPGVIRSLGWMERCLERSRARTWSAHYSARLVKDSVAVARPTTVPAP